MCSMNGDIDDNDDLDWPLTPTNYSNFFILHSQFVISSVTTGWAEWESPGGPWVQGPGIQAKNNFKIIFPLSEN